MSFGGLRALWVVVMFDLPTETALQRKRYHDFRKKLLNDGFGFFQYSVYGRHCPSQENADVHIKRVKNIVPPQGEVRVVVLTDKQFERMQIFYGKMAAESEKPPDQLSFF